MIISKCTEKDISILAELNHQLIEDEKSTNTMLVSELEERMLQFIRTAYSAYLFVDETNKKVIGYALINCSQSPLYLRQFFISRDNRRNHLGTTAFEKLIAMLKTSCIEVDVLSWNLSGRKFWESLGFVPVESSYTESQTGDAAYHIRLRWTT